MAAWGRDSATNEGTGLVNSRKVCVALVTAAFVLQCVAGAFVLPAQAMAASAIITWTEQADFEANASTTGESTARVQVDTESSPGDVQLIGSVVGIGSGCYHVLCLQADRTVIAAGSKAATGGDKLNTQLWTDIVAVAGGFDHTVGLREDGTVAMTEPPVSSMDVSGWSDIEGIAAGWGFTVGLKDDGTVVTAGPAQGHAQDTSSWTEIVAVAAGTSHTLGLRADGSVLAVGLNDANQLDTGTWSGVVAVAGGGNHSVGLKSDGTVVAVGDNSRGQCDVGAWTDVVAIAAGGYHTVGLKEDGTVVATPDSAYGATDVSTWTDIIAISTGYAHTVALRSDRTLAVAGADWVIGDLPDALMYPAIDGSIGLEAPAVGLRTDLGEGGVGGSLAADFDTLSEGETVKFGMRVSDDGVTWSEVLGSDGDPVDWTSGSGTYLG